MSPIRVQRKRTKGWRMPNGAVSVTRPGPFGNPYFVGYTVQGSDFTIQTVDEALVFFRYYAEARLSLYPHWLNELRGKDLACWCPIPEMLCYPSFDTTHPSVYVCSVCNYSQPDYDKEKVEEHIRSSPHCHADILKELANREVAE